MSGKSLVPRGSGEGGIGKSDVWWGTGYFNNIYCDTGYFGDELLLSGRDVMEIIDTTVEEKIEEVGGGPRWERAETEGNIYFPNNVGINNVNPSEKLDISGNVLVSNNLTVSNLLSGRSISTQNLSISGTGFSTVAKDLSLEVLQPGSNIFLDKDSLRRTVKIHTLHEPIQSAESSINQGRTYIQSIGLDEHGHVIDLISGTETEVDTQRTDDEIKDIGTGVIKEGANIIIDKNTSNKTLTINSHHPLVPRAQENSDNSGRDYIQNIKFDEYGHVTGLEVGTETITSENVLSKVKAGENVRVLDNDVGGVDIYSDHPSVESLPDTANVGRTYIDNLKFDSYGHITGVSSSQETLTLSDISDNATSFFTAGDNITLFPHGDSIIISSSHEDIPDATNSSLNSSREYIQSVMLDEYGHVTGLSSASETFIPRTDGEILDIAHDLLLAGDNISLDKNDSNKTVTINSSHVPVTPAQSVTNSSRSYIQSIELDEHGHILNLSSASETFLQRTDSEISSLIYNLLRGGDNISIDKNDSTQTVTINSSHITISNSASNTTNSGRQYIRNLTFDSYGHVISTDSSSERTDSEIINTVGAALVAGDNITIDRSANDKIKINYDLASEILNSAYPVGSIYISVDSASPASIFGGTWVRFAQGRCLIGLDSGDADFDNISETGGSKTHTLTVNEMPVHNHGATPEFNDASSRGTLSSNFSLDGSNIVDKGGGAPHNNMQPYIVVAMWQRTS